MSQIGSSSGVRVAAQPLSNVYTVLLLVAGLALVVALVFVCLTMDKNYGTILGVSEEGKRNKELPDAIAKDQADALDQLKQVDAALERFPEGIAPAAGTGEEPVAPTPPAPEPPYLFLSLETPFCICLHTPHTALFRHSFHVGIHGFKGSPACERLPSYLPILMRFLQLENNINRMDLPFFKLGLGQGNGGSILKSVTLFEAVRER